MYSNKMNQTMNSTKRSINNISWSSQDSKEKEKVVKDSLPPRAKLKPRKKTSSNNKTNGGFEDF